MMNRPRPTRDAAEVAEVRDLLGLPPRPGRPDAVAELELDAEVAEGPERAAAVARLADLAARRGGRPRVKDHRALRERYRALRAGGDSPDNAIAGMEAEGLGSRSHLYDLKTREGW